MINELDKTLEELLTQELRFSNGPVEISFSAPNGDWVSKLGNLPTLNFFLYDVRENGPLRRHQWQQLNAMPAATTQARTGRNGRNGASDHEPPPDLRRLSTAHLKRTPLMIDCHYMVSAWSPADERTRPLEEHHLLSHCMLALARYPILNPERAGAGAAMLAGHNAAPNSRPTAQNYLMGQLATQEVEIRTRLAHHDMLTNPAEVWSALENQMRAAFSYVVTLPMDPWDLSVQTAERVGVAEFTTQQTRRRTRPTNAERFDPSASDESGPDRGGPRSNTLYRLAGKVWNKAVHPAEPLAGVQVVVMDVALSAGTQNLGLYRHTRTDSQGRFSIPRLHPNDYTILVISDQDDDKDTNQEVILAKETISIIASTGDLPEEQSNILVDIEVDLPKA